MMPNVQIENVSSVLSRIHDRILSKTPLCGVVDIPRHCHRFLKVLTEHFEPNDVVMIGGNDILALIESLILELSIDTRRPLVVLCEASAEEVAAGCDGLKTIARKEDLLIVAGSPISDLDVLSSVADVGVLVEDSEQGSRLDFFDRRIGEWESAYCYYQGLSSSQAGEREGHEE